MQALAFWKAVLVDQANFLESLIGLLAKHRVQYCVIGGQAVNAYVEPLVSLDLDLAVVVEQIGPVEGLLREHFLVERFPHSLNVSTPGSKLRVQIQTDPRYSAFVARAAVRDVLGVQLPVASVEDVLQGKLWSTLSKGDLLDIERLLEVYPDLRVRVPNEVLSRLV